MKVLYTPTLHTVTDEKVKKFDVHGHILCQFIFDKYSSSKKNHNYGNVRNTYGGLLPLFWCQNFDVRTFVVLKKYQFVTCCWVISRFGSCHETSWNIKGASGSYQSPFLYRQYTIQDFHTCRHIYCNRGQTNFVSYLSYFCLHIVNLDICMSRNLIVCTDFIQGGSRLICAPERRNTLGGRWWEHCFHYLAHNCTLCVFLL